MMSPIHTAFGLAVMGFADCRNDRDHEKVRVDVDVFVHRLTFELIYLIKDFSKLKLA